MGGARARRQNLGIPLTDVSVVPSFVDQPAQFPGIVGRHSERFRTDGIAFYKRRETVRIGQVAERVLAGRSCRKAWNTLPCVGRIRARQRVIRKSRALL